VRALDASIAILATLPVSFLRSQALSVKIVLTTLPSDDLTVQVIFFGEGQKTGEVLVNQEASSLPKSPVRAKL
jgi:hypothetical protein